MWLVAVVGRYLVGCEHYEGFCLIKLNRNLHSAHIIQDSAPQLLPTCFGHHYAHLQENKDPVTAFGVYWSGFVGCGW